MTRYVLGFIFDKTNPDLVVLLRKDRPAWQAGKLNGVGGKINPGESPYEAMVREAAEEVELYNVDWDPLGKMHGDTWEVSLYRTSASVMRLRQGAGETEELVIQHYAGASDAIPNLQWLLPYARFFNREHSEEWIDVQY